MHASPWRMRALASAALIAALQRWQRIIVDD
jgi:hypothetical protein